MVYTKHIYAGTQRIASKLGDIEAFGADPRRVAQAGHDVDNAEEIDFSEKYSKQNDAFKARFDSLDSKFNGKSLDDYVNGQSFCCGDKNLDEIEKNGENKPENAKIEDNLYFYHPDHLGSTSMVTNFDGEVTQNVAYIPYGEVFVEEQNGNWATPFLFNAKELDEETGLYYYGARYLDPTMATWLSVDPMFEKYVGMTPYNYCENNPVIIKDPTGKQGVRIIDDENKEITIKADYYVQTEARPYWNNNKGGKEAKYLKGYSEKDIAKMNKNINKYLNKLDLKVSEGEYKGYKVKFDLQFIAGGSVENCEKMAGSDLFNGIPIGNSFTKGSPLTWIGFKARVAIKDGVEIKSYVGGITRYNMQITMNSPADSEMARVHEIFHTFGLSHPKGVGGSHGIMKYPPEDPDQDEINELMYNDHLKSIKK